MKIAMIMSKSARNRVISQKAMDRFSLFGEVAVNDTEGDLPEQVKCVKGADIAVTSWAIQIYRRYLDCARRPQACVHAAGSVKPLSRMSFGKSIR